MSALQAYAEAIAAVARTREDLAAAEARRDEERAGILAEALDALLAVRDSAREAAWRAARMGHRSDAG